MKRRKLKDYLIACALLDLTDIHSGTRIRIVELIKNLNISFLHSSSSRRPLKYLKSMPKILSYRNIILFGSYGMFFDNLFLNFLKRKFDRIIYDVADIPHLQRLFFRAQSINTCLRDVYFEKGFYSLVNLSNILLVISQSQLKLMNYKGHKKTVIVPNASNPNFFKDVPINSKIKNIIYVGGYAPARGIDELVDAFNILNIKHHDIRLKLIGFNMPLRYQSKNIIVERNKVYSDMPKTYSEAYLCVIPHIKNPYMDIALPIKLYDSMASARPVVVTDCFETKNLVNKEKCGIITKDNPNSIAKAIEYLLYNPSIAEEMGKKGREAVIKRHSWKHRANTIARAI